MSGPPTNRDLLTLMCLICSQSDPVLMYLNLPLLPLYVRLLLHNAFNNFLMFVYLERLVLELLFELPT